MRIWGFDLGTTSIGFAVLDHGPARGEGHIVRLGVRIFPEGVTEEKKEPRNKIRRAKRLMRRGIRRRKLRRRLLGQTLAKAGLLPQYGTSAWDAVMASDPYELRRTGLIRGLEPQELGRAFYHLAKRRGFLGRGTDEEKSDPDQAAARADAQQLRQQLGDRTLGAFLAEQPKKRGRHQTREIVQDEFDRLWEAQKPHHPILSDPSFAARIRNLMFWQRPTFWRLSTLGECPWVPGSDLAPKGSWIGQHYLVLEQLTKLRIAGANQRPLMADERAILLDLAQRQKFTSWSGVRKGLRSLWRDGGEAEFQRFNMEVSGAEKGIKGNVVEFELAKIFGTAWAGHPFREEIRREIHERLWSADYARVGNARIEIRRRDEAEAGRRACAEAMRCDWNLTDDQAIALAALELPTGWLRLSAQAVETMLPEMEQGHGVGELLNSPDFALWRDNAFPTRRQPSGEIHDRLPSHPRSMPQLRNPTIHRVLNELRKVTNNLLGVYGRPDSIRVELTRELKESKERRSKRLSGNKVREADRKRAVDDLAAHGISNPDRDTIDKWLLWKESSERCPYTGDHIGFDALFREGKYQIEHIWPRSRSLDNTLSNKTLCRTDVNIAKGNRTPFEMYAHDTEMWQKIKLRLADCKLPEHKTRRFVKDVISDAGTDEFADRQLADTGWAAREARDFLKRLWPDDGSIAPVETVNGRITAQLRHQWGLNAILDPENQGKNRTDHRHHAIDALAVALTTRAFVKRLADWHRMRETGVHPPKTEAPWKGLFEEARSKVGEIVVSHRVQRKVSGPLHAETIMGDTGINESSKSGTYRLFVGRKPVERLSRSEIGAIRDPAVADLIAAHVAERGGDPKKALPPYPRLPGTDDGLGPEIRRVRLLVKQQLDLMAAVGTGYADAAANHHLAAYRTRNGRIIPRIVSMREAARRIAARHPVVERSGAGDETFIASFAPGDTLAFPIGDGSLRYRVVQSVWANGQVVLLDHTDASPQRVSKNQPGIASIIGSGAHKVSVDPIGRVRLAGD